MVQIDHLASLPKNARPLDERAEASEEDRKFHWDLGKEYFDGTRAQGLGGYYYDGRWKPVARQLAEYYGLGPASSVLDVGCAKGFLLHDFIEEVPGISVTGIDISGYALGEATDLTKSYVYMGNAKELPLPDDAFDLVISINSLHNILDRAEVIEALREIERVSRAHKYIKVGAYRNDEEKSILDNWAVVATTYLHVDDWLSVFEEAGYTGDYDWFNP
jgi:SAM-dependent methyltransferase